MRESFFDASYLQAMYKSDGLSHLVSFYALPHHGSHFVTLTAKSAYSLTENEMLALPHEAISCSSKTFYSQVDAKALSRRKFEAGAAKDGLACEEVRGSLRLFKKTDNDNRRRRANFTALFDYIDSSAYRRGRVY